MKNASIFWQITIYFITSFLLAGCSASFANQNKGNVMSQETWHHATNTTVKKYELSTEKHLKPYFNEANLHYPPQQLALLAFKQEKRMELWAKDDTSHWEHILNYPLTAISGHLGPKLKRNDRQIPEGIYHIVRFNPYSSFHLSMMLNYPNNMDKQRASMDGRRELGDNIFIHGKSVSVGCLAIGDKAIDELFVLVNKVGKPNTEVIIAPRDFRHSTMTSHNYGSPRWLPQLYQQLTVKLKSFTQA